MDIRSIKMEANARLRQANQSPRKIFFIHTAIWAGVSLVLALVSYILDNTVSSGGGLRGMDTQVALSTAQTVLQLISTVALPFWSAGLIYVALDYSRSQQVRTSDLAEGFRRFKPVLSSSLMMGLQYVARGIVSVYLTSMLVMVTPFAAPAYKLMQLQEENPQLDLFSANVEGIAGFYVATIVIFALVFGALALPVFYRYRMVNYIIMDEQQIGGLRALLLSRVMMHRRRWKLLQLDLSFWWYYGLKLLLILLSVTHLLLKLINISADISADTVYWISQIVAVAGSLALNTYCKPVVETGYALCYQQFRQQPEPEPVRQPKSHPWTY